MLRDRFKAELQWLSDMAACPCRFVSPSAQATRMESRISRIQRQRFVSHKGGRLGSRTGGSIPGALGGARLAGAENPVQGLALEAGHDLADRTPIDIVNTSPNGVAVWKNVVLPKRCVHDWEDGEPGSSLSPGIQDDLGPRRINRCASREAPLIELAPFVKLVRS